MSERVVNQQAAATGSVASTLSLTDTRVSEAGSSAAAEAVGERQGRQPASLTRRRFAYADPPYPGCAAIYKDHPDFAGEVDHVELVARLYGEYPDGWALSTSAAALKYVLSLCPPPEQPAAFRICMWSRSVVPRPPQRVMWCWEPLIVHTPHWRQSRRGEFVRDTLTNAGQPSGFLGGQITGAKPVSFCHWMFNLLGLGPEDELVDLFPGSGAVTDAWNGWRSQSRLPV